MKPFYTFNSVCHEERKKMVNFFSKSCGHALARPKIFFYGGESSKRERR